MKKDLANSKRTRFKKYFLLGVILGLTLLALWALVLVTYRPRQYAPLRITEKKQISRYLTNQLLPTIYNGSQLGEPFEVVITQDGLNDIIAHLPQPFKINSITLTDPQTILTPQQITLMATANVGPANFVLAVEVDPVINQQGLLNLYINNITLGAVDIRPMATLIGSKAYSNWMSSTGTEPNNSAAQICRSLLNNEPFEPVFTISNRPLRLSRIDIKTKKIIALLTPLPDQPTQVSTTPQTPAESHPASNQ